MTPHAALSPMSFANEGEKADRLFLLNLVCIAEDAKATGFGMESSFTAGGFFSGRKPGPEPP